MLEKWICGVNPTEFTNDIVKGYRQYCSNDCRFQDAREVSVKAQRKNWI